MFGKARARTLLRLAATALVTATLAGCLGWVPGRQAYWDAKVREMCEKDGHVRIAERVVLTQKEADLLPRTDGKLSVATRELAEPNAPVYLESKEVLLRDANPRVRRTEWNVIRRTDERVIAQWFTYGRVGGDFPSPAHPSSFRCPEWKDIWAELQALFIIKGE